MKFMPRFVTLGLIVGLVNISLAADESQKNSQNSKYFGNVENGITILAATDSPDPSTALDRDILKSSPFIDSTGILFFGSLDGSFRASRASLKISDALWEFVTGGEILSSPAVGNNGVLYFGSADKNVYALYSNGTLKWSFSTDSSVVSSPALSNNGTLYAGSKDGSLYALNPDGSLKWKYATNGAIYASPALALDGTVYIGSLDGSLYALSPDGALKWTYRTGGEVYSSASINFAGEIIFGSNDFKVYALNPDGTLKWSFATRGEVISTPAIDLDGSVYVGSSDGSLYKIDPEGKLSWESATGTPLWSSPIVTTKGEIISATCGAYRKYYTESNNVMEYFSAKKDGHIFSYGRAGSADENGPYGYGYTGAYTSAVNGMTIMLIDGGRSYGQQGNYSSIRGFDNTSWPRFRHDSRNTGNVAVSLAIPIVDTERELVTFSCDMDSNGRADFQDFFFMLLKVIAQQVQPSWDLDNSGRISISDAIVLLQRIVTHQCDEGSSLLASADSAPGAFQSLSAGEKQIVLNALAEAELSAEERELVQAALNGIAAPGSLPQAFSLEQNSPNPFNPSTTIAYEVPQSASTTVNLSVFDTRGRLVRTLVDGRADPGRHFVFWDGTDNSGKVISSGVYFYRLQAGSYLKTRKMVLLK